MRKWLTDKFIDIEFYAPFVIDKDNEYYTNPIKEIAEEEPFDLQMMCPV